MHLLLAAFVAIVMLSLQSVGSPSPVMRNWEPEDEPSGAMDYVVPREESMSVQFCKKPDLKDCKTWEFAKHAKGKKETECHNLDDPEANPPSEIAANTPGWLQLTGFHNCTFFERLNCKYYPWEPCGFTELENPKSYRVGSFKCSKAPTNSHTKRELVPRDEPKLYVDFCTKPNYEDCKTWDYARDSRSGQSCYVLWPKDKTPPNDTAILANTTASFRQVGFWTCIYHSTLDCSCPEKRASCHAEERGNFGERKWPDLKKAGWDNWISSFECFKDCESYAKVRVSWEGPEVYCKTYRKPHHIHGGS